MDLSDLGRRLGPQAVLLAEAERAGYEQGARYGNGRARAVLRPSSTEEVALVLRDCAQQGTRVVVQGANTGLVAASTPDASGEQIVLSLERLNKGIEVDLHNRSVTVDAGVKLSRLNEVLAEHGLMFPIDLSADPSVGGLIAANTGGAKLIRYGDVRRNVLGLEAVLMQPPGAVLDLMSALRKNNSGVDLKQLFIGTSGAFGVVTRAVLQVVPLARQSMTALVVPSSQQAILDLLGELERHCGDFLSAYEGISRNALAAALDHVPRLRHPFPGEPLPDYCVLVELSSTLAREQLNLEALLTGVLEQQFGNTIANAVLASDHSLWDIRHALSEGLRGLGRVIAFDIAVPRGAMPVFREQALEMIAQRFPHLVAHDFGHWGDGGCHFNLVWPHRCGLEWDEQIVATVRADVYDLVVNGFGGSFSAEHGVGPYNLEYYQRFVPELNRALSGAMQRLVDPDRRLGNTDFGVA